MGASVGQIDDRGVDAIARADAIRFPGGLAEADEAVFGVYAGAKARGDLSTPASPPLAAAAAPPGSSRCPLPKPLSQEGPAEVFWLQLPSLRLGTPSHLPAVSMRQVIVLCRR